MRCEHVIASCLLFISQKHPNYSDVKESCVLLPCQLEDQLVEAGAVNAGWYQATFRLISLVVAACLIVPNRYPPPAAAFTRQL